MKTKKVKFVVLFNECSWSAYYPEVFYEEYDDGGKFIGYRHKSKDSKLYPKDVIPRLQSPGKRVYELPEVVELVEYDNSNENDRLSVIVSTGEIIHTTVNGPIDVCVIEAEQKKNYEFEPDLLE